MYIFQMDTLDKILVKITLTQEAMDCDLWEKIYVLNVIFNRTQQRYFSDGTVTSTVLFDFQFSGWNISNENFRWLKRLLNFIRSDVNYDTSLDVLIEKAYNHDYTNDSLLYYSPNAMIPRGSKPQWNFSELEETIRTNNFIFYRLKVS